MRRRRRPRRAARRTGPAARLPRRSGCAAPRPRSRTTRSPRRPLRNDGTPSPRNRSCAPCWVPRVDLERLFTVERLEREMRAERGLHDRHGVRCDRSRRRGDRNRGRADPHASRTGRRGTPPRGAAGPRRASRSRWPSSIPAGTSTSSVRVPCTRPSPRHVWHGVGIPGPVPEHTWHGAAVTSWPSSERRTWRTSPVPSHVGHVSGCVPGAHRCRRTTSHSTGMRRSTSCAAEHDVGERELDRESRRRARASGRPAAAEAPNASPPKNASNRSLSPNARRPEAPAPAPRPAIGAEHVVAAAAFGIAQRFVRAR